MSSQDPSKKKKSAEARDVEAHAHVIDEAGEEKTEWKKKKRYEGPKDEDGFSKKKK